MQQSPRRPADDRGGNALNGLFETLGATFEAAEARAEDEAASDLAFSLLQGSSLVEALVDAGPLESRCTGGTSRPVHRVGKDYIATGLPAQVIIPLAHAVVARVQDGSPPLRSGDGLMDLVRAWSRSGRRVRIEAYQGVVEGFLARAGADYLMVATPRSEVFIGLSGIVSITVLDSP